MPLDHKHETTYGSASSASQDEIRWNCDIGRGRTSASNSKSLSYQKTTVLVSDFGREEANKCGDRECVAVVLDAVQGTANLNSLRWPISVMEDRLKRGKSVPCRAFNSIEIHTTTSPPVRFRVLVLCHSENKGRMRERSGDHDSVIYQS